MKIVGILLILTALIGGGIILSDTIPGWMRGREMLARAHAEATAAEQGLKTIPSSDRERDRSIRRADRTDGFLRDAEESIDRRRNETLMFGGGALAMLALGTYLVMRGRKKQTGAFTPRVAS